MSFNTIEEAILDIAAGKIIIVIDDEDRENEGDFVMAAEQVTAESINFMATHGRGLICAPVSADIAKKLELPLMVPAGSDHHGTAFTVSIDASQGITTGISASDRAHTLQLLAHPRTLPSDFVRPGHIFPLIAKNGGVLEREGHTEAAVDLADLAGLKKVGVICEILNQDGSCARVPDLIQVAREHQLKMITIADLIEHKKKQFKKDNQGLIYEQHC